MSDDRRGRFTIIACLCLGINEQTVREHVRSGARMLAELARVCGAGSDCAMCRDRLLGLIADEKERDESAS